MMACKYCMFRPKVFVNHGPLWDEKTNTWHLRLASDEEVYAANRCRYCEYISTLEAEPELVPTERQIEHQP
jgi:hypothetical protein